jgi:hypothetical protein
VSKLHDDDPYTPVGVPGPWPREFKPLTRDEVRAMRGAVVTGPMLAKALDSHELLQARAEQLERERDEAEAREKQLREALARSVFLAQHLWQMIPPEVWREHGSEWKGDYQAERVRDELAALASVSAEEPSE